MAIYCMSEELKNRVIVVLNDKISEDNKWIDKTTKLATDLVEQNGRLYDSYTEWPEDDQYHYMDIIEDLQDYEELREKTKELITFLEERLPICKDKDIDFY